LYSRHLIHADEQAFPSPPAGNLSNLRHEDQRIKAKGASFGKTQFRDAKEKEVASHEM
jgi:hypothetical protein